MDQIVLPALTALEAYHAARVLTETTEMNWFQAIEAVAKAPGVVHEDTDPARADTIVRLLEENGVRAAVRQVVSWSPREHEWDSPPIWRGPDVEIRRVENIPVGAEPSHTNDGYTYWKSQEHMFIEVPKGITATVAIENSRVVLEEGTYEFHYFGGTGTPDWNIGSRGPNSAQMTPQGFEQLVAILLFTQGFTATQTKQTGDGGIDIIATRSDSFLSGKYVIQCKHWSHPVGEPIVRDLYGVVTAERANKGILVTTSVFTRQACEFAEGKPIELIDGNQLSDLIGRMLKVKGDQKVRPRNVGGPEND